MTRKAGVGRAVGVALVGVGAWGSRVLAALQRLPEFEVLLLCDSAESNRSQSELPYGTFSQVLADRQIQAVVIATPENTHAELALLAMDAGKWVFVEKPLCVTAVECQALLAHPFAARRLMVGHLLHFDPYFRALRLLNRMLEQGGLGPGFSRVESVRHSLPGARPERSPWWALAPHDISVLLSLWGMPAQIRLAHAQSGLLASLIFRKQRRAELSISVAATERRRIFAAVGSGSSFVLDDSVTRRLTLNWGNAKRTLSVPDTSPLSRELRAFHWGISKGQLGPGVQHGQAVVQVLLAGEHSLNSGGWSEVKHEQ